MISSIPRTLPLADGLRSDLKQPRQRRAVPRASDNCTDRIGVHVAKYRTDSSKTARTDNSESCGHASGMDHKAEFSSRLNDALDAIGYPAKGKGRQVRLGKDMHTSQKGARKWLEGEAIPSMDHAIGLALLAHVHIEWLLTGRGPRNLQSHPISTNPQIQEWAKRMECISEPDRERIFRVIAALVPADMHGEAA